MPETAVLARCRFFTDVQVWPLRTKLDPDAWLSNFDESERALASMLLARFLYFPDTFVEATFRAAFRNLSQFIVRKKRSYVTARSEWGEFVKSCIVVRVTGENPSDTDSGYLFERLARDKLDISEQRIMGPQEALNLLVRAPTDVVFVDDFVGSGAQFLKTWQRQYPVLNGARKISFQDCRAFLRQYVRFFYIPIVATKLGYDRITQLCSEVEMVPGYTLSERYSALSDTSLYWDDEEMRCRGQEMIMQVSKKAGIADVNGDVGDWRGFQKLGLAVSFNHGWPDATLPLFYWKENGWKPLLRK